MKQRSERLHGKVAVVTGGSKGLGVAIAHELSAAGASVALLARDTAKGEAVAAEIRSTGASAIFVTADVTHDEDIERAVAHLVDRLGSPSVLVNNAALTPSTLGAPAGNAVEIDLDTWRRFLDVNLTGALLTVRHVVPHMRDGGAIVNINSIAAMHPRRHDVAYAASKAGLSGLTRAMALDFAPDIRVNEIITGSIPNADNPRHAHLVHDPEARGRLAGNTLVGRPGEPSDVALACLYLASDDAGFVTGQSIVIDGGSHVPMRTLAGAGPPRAKLDTSKPEGDPRSLPSGTS
jgi:NAD(P)-dependent dehydrogenase (short-subunit alcohol dehydrogenase family)